VPGADESVLGSAAALPTSWNGIPPPRIPRRASVLGGDDLVRDGEYKRDIDDGVLIVELHLDGSALGRGSLPEHTVLVFSRRPTLVHGRRRKGDPIHEYRIRTSKFLLASPTSSVSSKFAGQDFDVKSHVSRDKHTGTPKFKTKAAKLAPTAMLWLSSRSMLQGSLGGMNDANWIYYR
jgi:hypothetical protein